MQYNTKFLDKICSRVGLLTSCLLLVLGGYVRATGAGLSCPDWPLCFNQAVPDFSIPGVLQEVGHRYLAFFVSLCVVVVCSVTYRNRQQDPRRWQVARWMLPVLFSQVILGGLTVLMLLKPLIVTLHLLFGTLLVQLFFILATESKDKTKTEPQNLEGMGRFTGALTIGILLILIQVALGGFVGSSGLSLICRDIPGCGSSFLGTLPQEHIHMAHRLLGVLVLVYLSCVTYGFPTKFWRELQVAAVQRYSIALLVAVQIGLGVMNIWFHVAIPIALSHLLLAQIILAVVINVRMRVKGR